MASRLVEVVVVAGDRGCGAGGGIDPALQLGIERGQGRLVGGDQLPLALEAVALGAQPLRLLELGQCELVEINGAVHQVAEASRREEELDPAEPAELVYPADLLLERVAVLEVGKLVSEQIGFCLLQLGSQHLELVGDRRQVGIAPGKLGLKAGESLAHLRLLHLQGLEMLLLLRLLLLQPVQPVGERVRIIRLRRQSGEQEQQYSQRDAAAKRLKRGFGTPRATRVGRRARTFYSDGAPAEPGMPGSRRGVKVVPPNGGAAALGFFSFFFFFSSRRPRSRDLAMVPASQSVFGEWLL